MPEHHSSPDLSHATTPASHILDMAQCATDLPPKVEERKNGLVQEVLDLCRKYGLAHPKELETSPLASKISFEDLELLLACTTELEYIVEHRELPENKEKIDDREYEIELPPSPFAILDVLDHRGYPVISGCTRDESVYFVKEPNKEFTFSAADRLGISLVICGERILTVQEYLSNDFITRHYSIRDLQGVPVSGFKEEGYAKVVQEDHHIRYLLPFEKKNQAFYPLDKEGNKIGRPEGYFKIHRVSFVGTHTYFEAKEQEADPYYLYDETGLGVSGEEYEDAHFIVNLGEELVFSVTKDSRLFFEYPDGTRFEGQQEEGFAKVSLPYAAEGKIYFFTGPHDLSQDPVLVDHTGTPFVEEGDPSMEKKFLPTAMRKVGDKMYFFEAQSRRGADTSLTGLLSSVTTKGERENYGTCSVFPIQVGERIVRVKENAPDLSFIFDDQERRYGIVFDKIYALEPIDDHRFYVIAQAGAKMVKKVFDTRAHLKNNLPVF